MNGDKVGKAFDERAAVTESSTLDRVEILLRQTLVAQNTLTQTIDRRFTVLGERMARLESSQAASMKELREYLASEFNGLRNSVGDLTRVTDDQAKVLAVVAQNLGGLVSAVRAVYTRVFPEGEPLVFEIDDAGRGVGTMPPPNHAAAASERGTDP